MNARRNFADSRYEPSDADLAELMHEAFGGLKEAREASLRDLRAQVDAEVAKARAALERMRAGRP